MGFGQGLSGLNAAAQNLDVIGNNIANSGTVGFKASTATFADVYANSRVGIGTSVASINQRFTIGTVASTGNQFDMAIDGAKGLFRVVDPSGNVLYTRNGQFFADKDNNIVNAQGQRLTGYGPGGVNIEPVKVPVGNIPPQATSAMTTKANLDANATEIDVLLNPFDPANPDSYTPSHTLRTSVYDSLGNMHELTQYFAKRAANVGPPEESVWDVYYKLDGADLDLPASSTQQLTFDAAGRLVTPTGPVGLEYTTPGAGASPADPLEIALNYNDTTQFGGPFASNFTQDGFPTGEYASMSIANNGEILARYTNGQARAMGTLVLADFNNLQGMQPVGGNAWVETSASGQPVYGKPGENGMATIRGQAVEESNVDMSMELVNMIIAQRTYQANAQTIKTQDQILQTLITMR